MKILSVVGARPNFMKIAPFIKAVQQHNAGSSGSIEHLLVHTGQHYDIRMSQSFFAELGIPDPDINLGIGSGTHAEQLGNTMIAFEKVLLEQKPDWVIVVGDVNATLSCSVVAKKLNIKVCHIEAGLRSGDMTMPEEINRLVTDRIADLLLTPDTISSANLLREGVAPEKIVFTGNIMIDTLESNLPKAASLNLKEIIAGNLLHGTAGHGIVPENDSYAVVTMHRPSNVDDKKILTALTEFLLNEVATRLTLIWPLHPRTKKQLQSYGMLDKLKENPSVVLLEPAGYHAMLRLNMGARVMITDSGGLQEECCLLGTPCITLRWNTERPVTLREHGGVSVLAGNSVENIRREFAAALEGGRVPSRPEKWDGMAAERCLEAILAFGK